MDHIRQCFKKGSFLLYAIERYGERCDSIFMSGLVGGLFLSFLLATDYSCSTTYINQLIFIIGISHALFVIIDSLEIYTMRLFLTEESPRIFFWIKHPLKAVQSLFVIGLGSFVVEVREANRKGTLFFHKTTYLNCANASEPKICSYCQYTTVALTEIIFYCQLLYAVMLTYAWYVCWKVGKQDQDTSTREQQKSQLKLTPDDGFLYVIIRILFAVGNRSVFDENMAGIMLSLSLALPEQSCSQDVLNWFLAAGVIQMLRNILEDVSFVINTTESSSYLVYISSEGLGFASFLVFIGEMIVLVYISSTGLQDVDHVSFSEASPYFCLEGIWVVILAILITYCSLLLLRILLVLGVVLSDHASCNYDKRFYAEGNEESS